MTKCKLIFEILESNDEFGYDLNISSKVKGEVSAMAIIHLIRVLFQSLNAQGFSNFKIVFELIKSFRKGNFNE